MKSVLKLRSLPVTAMLVLATAITATAKPRNFQTHLSGSNEVPPVGTQAQGEVQFLLNEEGTELTYRLNVANIESVQAAHIHSAPAGVNGPVVVLLFGGPTTPGRTNGVLAEGIITSDELTGPLSGMTMTDLVQLISGGGAYVNVHTEAHPSGEIRGQLK